MNQSEVLCVSPDNRYRVEVAPWEARNTLWVYPPQIIDTEYNVCVFAFKDHCWSADRALWLSNTQIKLQLRKYPGDRAQAGLSVVIDCERRTADCGDGSQIELPCLEDTLEQMLDRLG